MTQQAADFSTAQAVFFGSVELERVMLGSVVIWEHPSAVKPGDGNLIYDWLLDAQVNFGSSLPQPEIHLPPGGTYTLTWAGPPPATPFTIMVTDGKGLPIGTWSGPNPQYVKLDSGATWTPPAHLPPGTKLGFYNIENYQPVGGITVG